MEPNNIDKQFSDQIHNHKSEMNLEELQSKESIWEQLEVNQNVVPVTTTKLNNWFLRIAAATLLIGLGTTALILNNKLNTQTEKYATLENEYQKVKGEVGNVYAKMSDWEEKMNMQLQETKAVKEMFSSVGNLEKENTVTSSFQSKIDTQYIAKTIIIKDTVFSVQRIEPQEVITYVRDTVFIKSPEIGATNIAETSDTKNTEENKVFTKSTMPKKVEFIFGPKPIQKPSKNGIQVEVNGTVIAKRH